MEPSGNMPSSSALDEVEEMNSGDDKGFSADHESVVEAHSSPPTEVKPSDALPEGTAKMVKTRECAVCSKIFGRKAELDRHIRTVHEKRADFKCEVCLRCFTEKGSLKTHILTVHEKRADFKCEVCLRCFTEKGSLTKHILTVHDKRADFKCEICSREFGQKSNLNKHIRNVHDKRTDV